MDEYRLVDDRKVRASRSPGPATLTARLWMPDDERGISTRVHNITVFSSRLALVSRTSCEPAAIDGSGKRQVPYARSPCQINGASLARFGDGGLSLHGSQRCGCGNAVLSGRCRVQGRSVGHVGVMDRPVIGTSVCAS